MYALCSLVFGASVCLCMLLCARVCVACVASAWTCVGVCSRARVHDGVCGWSRFFLTALVSLLVCTCLVVIACQV